MRPCYTNMNIIITMTALTLMLRGTPFLHWGCVDKRCASCIYAVEYKICSRWTIHIIPSMITTYAIMVELKDIFKAYRFHATTRNQPAGAWVWSTVIDAYTSGIIFCLRNLVKRDRSPNRFRDDTRCRRLCVSTVLSIPIPSKCRAFHLTVFFLCHCRRSATCECIC